MNELYNMGLSEDTIKSMLEQNPEISNLSDEEFNEKVELLKSLECSDNIIKNVISCNPMFLSKTNSEILKLANYMHNEGFDAIGILLDANPYILNLEPFEIDNYIKENMENGKNHDDIIDELESNPYLFSNL